MNLQAYYDLELARDELEERVAQEVTPHARSGREVLVLQAA